jgi:hypothetical protein
MDGSRSWSPDNPKLKWESEVERRMRYQRRLVRVTSSYVEGMGE